jgi:hypothetical protein
VEDHKDPSRVAIALEAVEGPIRVIPLPEVVEDQVIVQLQAKVLLPVSRALVPVKKVPHVPVQERSPIAPERARPIAVKMAAGLAGMMRIMARLFREQVRQLRLVLRFSRAFGMRSWKALLIPDDSLQVSSHGKPIAALLQLK